MDQRLRNEIDSNIRELDSIVRQLRNVANELKKGTSGMRFDCKHPDEANGITHESLISSLCSLFIFLLTNPKFLL